MNAEYQRRWRERQVGRMPPPQPPTCSACGRNHRGVHGALCSRCWQSLTPEGRADRAARVARSRQRQRLAKS